ncbi:hypothetical protein AA0242T_2873 [Acetobacter aceti NRIC 0242]|uniref:Primase C-terminal 2 domain-containing protein n=1 Tax=Acetobacter aceti NBRC 14818 TaxID=887700 RepID=A0AB33IFQ1_ACEAC|nr:hypothetical protein [Acetobacter aceti]BCK75860.1 hypothetical protein EMQ_1466 [Acetobacter aceti NBRC 14818]GAN58870.1 hypothetical protein Abac_087_001 [Acetobacter aceti NBRC 14818]GBO82171.1 hypothetical protein AA0242T_2873 [Acetobacter aceti NRIC 0242]
MIQISDPDYFSTIERIEWLKGHTRLNAETGAAEMWNIACEQWVAVWPENLDEHYPALVKGNVGAKEAWNEISLAAKASSSGKELDPVKGYYSSAAISLWARENQRIGQESGKLERRDPINRQWYEVESKEWYYLIPEAFTSYVLRSRLERCFNEEEAKLRAAYNAQRNPVDDFGWPPPEKVSVGLFFGGIEFKNNAFFLRKDPVDKFGALLAEAAVFDLLFGGKGRKDDAFFKEDQQQTTLDVALDQFDPGIFEIWASASQELLTSKRIVEAFFERPWPIGTAQTRRLCMELEKAGWKTCRNAQERWWTKQ